MACPRHREEAGLAGTEGVSGEKSGKRSVPGCSVGGFWMLRAYCAMLRMLTFPPNETFEQRSGLI